MHEVLLQLFRNRPDLAPELLREALRLELPMYTEARIESADFSQLAPTGYHADLVVLLGDDVNDAPVLGIVVEVQLTPKPRKRFTWPLYLTALRAKLECDTCVLVIAPTIDVARWAAEPIAIGFNSVVAPLVVGPGGVPIVTDVERATRAPELAVLSVMAHGQGDVDTAVKVALAAAAGVTTLPEDQVVLYSDLIVAALSEAARKAFLMLPEGYEFQSPIGRESFRKGIEQGLSKGIEQGLSKGIEQGLSKGIEQGLSKGIEQGILRGRAMTLLEVLDARGFVVSGPVRERILGCADPELLARWSRRAATAATLDSLFE